MKFLRMSCHSRLRKDMGRGQEGSRGRSSLFFTALSGGKILMFSAALEVEAPMIMEEAREEQKLAVRITLLLLYERASRKT